MTGVCDSKTYQNSVVASAAGTQSAVPKGMQLPGTQLHELYQRKTCVAVVAGTPCCVRS